MSPKYLDIVYVVKDAAFNEELRYSLRSVEQNFPYNRVFFYGGKPMYFHPDKLVLVKQRSGTKWDKVRSMLKLIAEDDRLTENFILFNDDFFVLKPVDRLPVYKYGTLEQLCNRIESKNHGRPTPYTLSLKRTIKALEEKGLPTANFELHLPMVFNRGDLKEIMNLFPDIKGTRSLYGNAYLNEEDTEDKKDVKIFKCDTPVSEDADYASTEDQIFARGIAGEMIKAKFPDKSKWER